MSIERIALEWRYVQLPGSLEVVGHLCLVAREAGQTNGDGKAISGNPSKIGNENPLTGDYGYLQINLGDSSGAGGLISNTVDIYGDGVTELSSPPYSPKVS